MSGKHNTSKKRNPSTRRNPFANYDMAVKQEISAKRKKRKSPVAVFVITFITVFAVGCGALLFLSLQGKEENISLTEQLTAPQGTENILSGIINAIKSEDAEAVPPQTDVTPPQEDMPTVEDGEVTIAFAGDILLDDDYSMMATLHIRRKGIAGCIDEELLHEMQTADIFMLNNEFTFTERGEALAEKQFTFRAKPENVSVLHDMGVDIVALANNHAYDYGEISLLDTLDTLNGAGIRYVGAGRDLEEAAAPAYYDMEGMRLGIIAATQIERIDNPDTKGATSDSPGVFRCWNPDKLLAVVEETKQNCDFVIVYIHWGTEGTEELDWAQCDQAVQIAQAGADLIVGNHPHCLQSIDYIGNVPVIYSLGNFWFNSKTLDTCLVKAVITEEGLQSLQFLPALQENCSTSMLHGEEKERVLTYMRGISANVTIDSEGYITKK